jgi:hypothetical protein
LQDPQRKASKTARIKQQKLTLAKLVARLYKPTGPLTW